MQDSFLINKMNSCLDFFQSKLLFLKEKSLLLKNFDNVVFIFIALTILISLFSSTDLIGICIFFTLLVSVINILLSKEQKFYPKSFDIALFIFLIISLMSLFNSTMPLASLKGLFKTLTYIGFYFSCAQFFSYNTSKIKYIILLVSGCVLFESVVAIFQNYTHILPRASWQDVSQTNPEDVLSRAFGTLQPYNPNLLASYLVIGCPFILSLSLKELLNKKYFTSIFALISFFISALAIILTGSRGAYLALAGISLAIVLISYRFIFIDLNNDIFKKYWKIFIAISCSIVTLIILSTPSILKRILSIFVMRGDSSTSFRMNVYQSSFEMFKDNWLLGIGLGNTTFREIYGYYMKSGFDALSAYSIYLETAVETGILGLIAFLSFLYLILKPAIKFILSNVELHKKILISCCFLSILGALIHGLFDTVFYRPQAQVLFWLVIAILNIELNKLKNK